MIDGSNVRRLASRWVFGCRLRLETAARFGGDADPGDPADLVVLRERDLQDVDGRERPLLPGTTLAGALRAHLATGSSGMAALRHRTW